MIALSAIPLLLAAATLLSEWLAPDSSGPWWRIAALACLLGLPTALVFTARRLPSSALASRLLAAPALLAPLAVAFPWTAAPSHLGVGFGELGFFLHWLTKYPTWGAINLEVLLGILCILGCSFLPWLAATLALVRGSSRITRAGLLGLALIPYVPVLIRLDLLLIMMGVLVRSTALQPAPPVWVALGALLRLASILSMVALVVAPSTPTEPGARTGRD